MTNWGSFIALLNERQPIKGGHKSFLGSISKYAKLFHEANPPGPGQPELGVFFESVPESNGKRNWTVMIYATGKDGFAMFDDAIQIERTEYYDRARYEADRCRYLLGLIKDRPNILDYDEGKLCP